MRLKKIKTVVNINRNQVGEKGTPQQYQQQMSKDQYWWNGSKKEKRKKKKPYEMSRGKISDFERIKAEEILRVSNEIRLRAGKSKM